VISGLLVFKLHIQGVSAILGQTSVGSFHHRNEKKKKFASIYIYINNRVVFVISGLLVFKLHI